MELSLVLCGALEGWGARYGGEGWRVGENTPSLQREREYGCELGSFEMPMTCQSGLPENCWRDGFWAGGWGMSKVRTWKGKKAIKGRGRDSSKGTEAGKNEVCIQSIETRQIKRKCFHFQHYDSTRCVWSGIKLTPWSWWLRRIGRVVSLNPKWALKPRRQPFKPLWGTAPKRGGEVSIYHFK